MPYLIRFLSIAVAGVVVAGCDWPPSGTGSSGGATTGTTATSTVTPASSPPILEDASMSASASPDNGEYLIIGSLTYSCDACGEDSIHTVRVTVPVLGKSYDYPAGDTTSGYGIPFSFYLSDDIPLAGAGDTNYEIILVTKGGVQSAPVLKTVTLL